MVHHPNYKPICPYCEEPVMSVRSMVSDGIYYPHCDEEKRELEQYYDERYTS